MVLNAWAIMRLVDRRIRHIRIAIRRGRMRMLWSKI